MRRLEGEDGGVGQVERAAEGGERGSCIAWPCERELNVERRERGEGGVPRPWNMMRRFASWPEGEGV